MKSKLKFNLQMPQLICFIIIVLYFIMSLITLDTFPFVHSDETWLGGLSRVQMLSSSFKVTEPFFDLYPRAPHGIKILFHLVQMPFILIGGYNIFSLRLLSYIASIVVVFLWHKLLKITFGNSFLYFGGLLLLCLNIQFLYASHFARQEIILVIYQILGLYWLTAPNNKHLFLKLIFLSSSIFIHPNAAIIYVFIFILFTIKIITNKNILPMEDKIFPTVQQGCISYKGFSTKNMFINLMPLLLSVVLVIAISFWLNPNFVNDYISFGSSLGVTHTPIEKIKQFTDYIYKLFYQQSATYFMPNIKLDMVLIFLISILSLKRIIKLEKNIHIISALSMIVSYCLVTVIVGRYNTTSIIFFIIPGLYLLLLELNFVKVPVQKLLIYALILVSTYNLVAEVSPWKEDHYSSYIESINNITRGESTLGNLNMDFAFEPYKLYDFRNLDFLENNQLSVYDYINNNNIRYIALPSEMNYISKNISLWNILYGNINVYYPELIGLIDKYGDHVGTIDNDFYSVRILRYIGTPSWETNIYKITLPVKSNEKQ